MSESKQSINISNILKVSILLALLAVIALLGVLVAIGATNGGNGSDGTRTPEPTVVVTLEDLRFISELSTVEYKVVAEVQNERIPEDVRRYLNVKEQILMLVYADVKAGFDLSELSASDLQARGTRVQLILPSPKILSVTLDHERTHTVYHDKTLLIKSDPEVVERAFEVADKAVREQAVNMEILEKAETFGKVYFENQLRLLGFTDVQVTIK